MIPGALGPVPGSLRGWDRVALEGVGVGRPRTAAWPPRAARLPTALIMGVLAGRLQQVHFLLKRTWHVKDNHIHLKKKKDT